MKRFCLPGFQVPKEEHTARQNCHEEAARSLKDSFDSFDMKRFEDLAVEVTLKTAIPLASDPKWAQRPFGAVSTVEEAGCLAMVSKLILDFLGKHLFMEDLLCEIEQKGYRLWKLEKSKTLTIPRLELESLKAAYPEDDPIQECHSLEEVFALYGKPIGIGGSMFFVDQLIAFLAESPIAIYKDTRIHSAEHLISNLKNGLIVPMRVNNAIYHDNPKRTGGHYLTLLGIFQGEALLADSSKKTGYYLIPFERLKDAMLADKHLICAWDISPCCKRA